MFFDKQKVTGNQKQQFSYLSHGNVLESTNHELLPALKMSVYYKYYTPNLEKKLYYPVTLTCVDRDWLTWQPFT